MAKKILLIEDEKILAEMYRDKLKEAGFEVILAHSAEEGLEILEREKPDLVLLDMLLPKENGIYFLKELRRNPAIASIKVVAFSNYDDPDTKNQAFELGAFDYLIKTNFTPQEIIKRIEEYFK